MPIPYMPHELVSLILDLIVEEYTDPSHRSAAINAVLAPCALVCKEWRPLVLDVVFREVTITDNNMGDMIPLLLARPDLLGRVRRLAVDTSWWGAARGQIEDSYADFAYSSHFDGLVAILQAAPDLRHVELPARLPYALLIVTASHGPARRTLRSLDVLVVPAPDVEKLDFTRMWPAIQSFEALDSLRLRTVSDSPAELPPVPLDKVLRLKSLSLAAVCNTPDKTLVDALPGVIDLGRLRRLRLGFGPNGEGYPLALATRCSALERLDLSAIEAEDLEDACLNLGAAVGSLRHLVSLRIQHTQLTAIKAPTSLEAFVKSLPRSIRLCRFDPFVFDYDLSSTAELKRALKPLRRLLPPNSIVQVLVRLLRGHLRRALVVRLGPLITRKTRVSTRVEG